MRTIERSTGFKKDYKRIKASPRHCQDLKTILPVVIELLLEGLALPENNRDHPLSGEWAGYRECHLKPDLLLI